MQLPKVEESETLPTDNDPVVLSIKENGAFFLDTHEIAADSLRSVLTSTVQQPRKQLLVRADAGVNYGKVMQAMGLIRAAGITDVGLVTLSADSSATAAPAMPLP